MCHRMTRHAGIFIIEKLSDCPDEAEYAGPWMVSYNVKILQVWGL